VRPVRLPNHRSVQPEKRHGIVELLVANRVVELELVLEKRMYKVAEPRGNEYECGYPRRRGTTQYSVQCAELIAEGQLILTLQARSSL
jgi:hypothetical protein